MLEDSSRHASSVSPWGQRQWRSHQILAQVLVLVLGLILILVLVLIPRPTVWFRLPTNPKCYFFICVGVSSDRLFSLFPRTAELTEAGQYWGITVVCGTAQQLKGGAPLRPRRAEVYECSQYGAPSTCGYGTCSTQVHSEVPHLTRDLHSLQPQLVFCFYVGTKKL